MSPASFGTLEVQRYVGACLFSQNRSKNGVNNRDSFERTQSYPRNGCTHLQSPPSVGRWAGVAPLISLAGQYQGRHHYFDTSSSHLALLAAHTQGAPLILTKSFGNQKNVPESSITNFAQQTEVFENVSGKICKTHEPVNGGSNSVNGVDSISVTSDESFGFQNSETCLPRIIKPRKRRKKDRKPLPRLHQSHHITNNLSKNSPNPDTDSVSLTNILPYLPYITPFTAHNSSLKAGESKQCFDLLCDISEAPKLHHSFEEVEEVEDVSSNQPVSTCQCRYCDPQGQIWDVDRNCYSPSLTPPKSFDCASLLSSPYSALPFDSYDLPLRISAIALKEEKYKTSFSRSASSSSTSSDCSVGDLEVSTEIVTSLNGHRDIEIKFWLGGAVEPKSTNTNISYQLIGDKT